jgi:hypothetical protein
MNELVGSAVGQLALLAISWSMMAAGLWRFAQRADDGVSAEGKQQARDWLMSANLRAQAGRVLRSGPAERPWQSMATSLTHAFDAVFSNNYFSWTCFRRSVAASLFFTAAVCILWLATRQIPAGFASDITGAEAAATVVTVTLVLGCIPGYISLLKTRYMLAKLRASRSRAKAIMLVVADAIVSAAIGTLAIYALAVIGAREHFVEVTLVDLVRDLLQSNLDLVGVGGATLPLDLWFYASFLTSLWLWLFVLSKCIAVAARNLNTAVSPARRWIDVDGQPFRALATGSIVIVTIAYFVVVPLVALV